MARGRPSKIGEATTIHIRISGKVAGQLSEETENVSEFVRKLIEDKLGVVDDDTRDLHNELAELNLEISQMRVELANKENRMHEILKEIAIKKQPESTDQELRRQLLKAQVTILTIRNGSLKPDALNSWLEGRIDDVKACGFKDIRAARWWLENC